MNKSITILFIILLISAIGLSQNIGDRVRYTKQVQPKDEDINIISMGEDGMTLVWEITEGTFKKNLKFQLVILDTMLQQFGEKTIDIELGYYLSGYAYRNKVVYLLFEDKDNNFQDFQLVRMNIDLNTTQQYSIKNKLDYHLTHFEAINDRVILGGYFSNEPLVMIYNLTTQGTVVVPGFLQQDFTLLDVRPNQNNTFNILLESKLRENRKLVIKTFDGGANFLFEDEVVIKNPMKILDGFTSSLKQDNMLVAGTWSIGNNKKPFGFYSWSVNPFKEDTLQYSTFTEMKDFLDFMPEKRQERLSKKQKIRKEKKLMPTYSVHVKSKRLDENNQGFYLLAEVGEVISKNNRGYYNGINPYYNPNSYRRNTITPYEYYPILTSQKYPLLSPEKKILETVVVQYNSAGNYVDDFSFKTEHLTSHYDEQKTDFAPTKNGVVLAYKNKNELLRNFVDREQDLIVTDTLSLATTDDDKAQEKYEEDSGTLFWFNQHFYTWGYQTQPVKEKPERREIVFFIERISALN